MGALTVEGLTAHQPASGAKVSSLRMAEQENIPGICGRWAAAHEIGASCWGGTAAGGAFTCQISCVVSGVAVAADD